MSTGGHWFWWALTMACVIWYCTITVYVAFKGVFDIKGMLGRLEQKGIDDRNSRK